MGLRVILKSTLTISIDWPQCSLPSARNCTHTPVRNWRPGTSSGGVNPALRCLTPAQVQGEPLATHVLQKPCGLHLTGAKLFQPAAWKGCQLLALNPVCVATIVGWGCRDIKICCHCVKAYISELPLLVTWVHVFECCYWRRIISKTASTSVSQEHGFKILGIGRRQALKWSPQKSQSQSGKCCLTHTQQLRETHKPKACEPAH